MNNIKEISRRVICNTEIEGSEYNPCGILAVDGEIQLEDNGQVVFLHGQWIGECDNVISIEATKESVYEIYVKFEEWDADEEQLLAERDRIMAEAYDEEEARSRYGEFYKSMDEMIIDKLREQNIECYFTLDEE